MRTLSQNAAMHKYFRDLAFALNDAGLDMRKTLKPSIDIPWTEDSVKRHLWRPIQQAMTDSHSTTKLDTKQVGEIYEVLTRHLASKFGISVPFPTREDND